MSAFDLLLVVYGCVLSAAALAVVYRMIVGPTILDRALSSDSLVTLVVMGMALYSARSQAAWAGPAMLALTGLAFIGTVTFARFVAREDANQGRQRRHPDEPSTETGRHEAIHPGPLGAASAQDEPINHVAEELGDDPWGPEAVGGDPVGSTDAAAETTTGAEGEAGAEDDDVAGFGAQPGSRGFDAETGAGARWPGDEAERRWSDDEAGPRPEAPTEGGR